MGRPKQIKLDGQSLDLVALEAIVSGGLVILDTEALGKVADSNATLLRFVAKGHPIYGVTTGLGPKVVQSLSKSEINEFSANTIRGRAHSIGPPLAKETVRAAMAIRANTLLSGASGVSPTVVEHICACLNANLVPHIGKTASIGPADLMWGGSFALAMIGEGRFLGQGADIPSARALGEAGISPLKLGPRDGLGLVSHSAFSTAIGALALGQAKAAWAWLQTSAALSLEAFRANLTPFREDVLGLHNQPGTDAAAKDLRARLQGSALFDPDAARRLQDPLSFRNIAQVHGSAYAALATLEDCVLRDINGAPDSPVIAANGDEIVSTGNFLNPHLTVTLSAACHALTHVAALSTARIARLLVTRFTDLSDGLNDPQAGNAGLGPVTKLSEALFAEIARLSSPPPIYPSSSADGVEDVVNYSSLAGEALAEISDRLSMLSAIELIVSAQAIEQRDIGARLGGPMRRALETVRTHSPPLGSDRSLTHEIESLAAYIRRNPELS